MWAAEVQGHVIRLADSLLAAWKVMVVVVVDDDDDDDDNEDEFVRAASAAAAGMVITNKQSSRCVRETAATRSSRSVKG